MYKDGEDKEVATGEFDLVGSKFFLISTVPDQ